MYELVWTTMLILVFGYSSHSITAVISAFLFGLAIGSLLFAVFSAKKTTSQIKLYSSVEFGIGFLAILTAFVLPNLHQIYSNFSDGSVLSSQLLIVKFALSIAVLMLPTILMGATLPLLIGILSKQSPKFDNNISLLYGLNTLGAVLGIAVAAIASIELFGLRSTVFFAALINFTAGLLVFLVPRKTSNQNHSIDVKNSDSNLPSFIIYLTLFASGFISIAYEIIWTRLLTPITGTFIYAFAAILAIYLFGIALGSIIYNRVYSRFKPKSFTLILSQIFIGIFAICSSWIISRFAGWTITITLSVILPAAFFMGISFPAAIGLLKNNDPAKTTGISYFINTIGSILGGFAASFILIPNIGSSQSIILLSIFNFLTAGTIIFSSFKLFKKQQKAYLITFTSILIAASLLIFIFGREALYDTETKAWLDFARQENARIIIKEDEASTVVGIQGNLGYQSHLYVDGVGMTGKVPVTHFMAYFPVALHPDPKSMLIICLGMGSTYRSALLQGLETDVIELSPSVAEMFPLFYKDAAKIQSEGKGRIIVNDGRNYVNLTDKKYDLITLDPPPPFNTAGSTVLYSEDFYKSMKRILNPGGIVLHWVPIENPQDQNAKMAIKSFINIFPYAFSLKSPVYPKGIFLTGSFTLINVNPERINKIFSSKAARSEFDRFNEEITAARIIPLITQKDKLVEETKGVLPITDNNPRTEYFLLRRFFTNQ